MKSQLLIFQKREKEHKYSDKIAAPIYEPTHEPAHSSYD